MAQVHDVVLYLLYFFAQWFTVQPTGANGTDTILHKMLEMQKWIRWTWVLLWSSLQTSTNWYKSYLGETWGPLEHLWELTQPWSQRSVR